MNYLRQLFYKFYSLLFCLRYLPLGQAFHIPVLIHPSVRVKLRRGCISFHGPLRSSMLVIGFPGTTGQSNCRTLINIECGGRFVVAENVQMARGTRVVIGRRGTLQIGRHFWCNGDCYFHCTTNITIGDENMYGWNISFNTSDGHHVYEKGVEKPMEGDIIIGRHVWIASHCIVGKNTYVADDCVVAQHSLLSKAYNKSYCLIAGMPGRLVKENFSWTER